jgi:hypothetical protein
VSHTLSSAAPEPEPAQRVSGIQGASVRLEVAEEGEVVQ